MVLATGRKRIVKRRFFKTLFWAVLIGGVIWFFFSPPPRLFNRIIRNANASQARLLKYLDRHHGLVYYDSMDFRFAPHLSPQDRLSQTGAKQVKGRTGGARRFRAGSGAVYPMAVGWGAAFSPEGGISFWLKASKKHPLQTLFCVSRNGSTDFRMELRDGELQAFVPTAGGEVRLACPYPTMGRYAHIALVFEASAIRLYVDGVLQAEQPRESELMISNRPITFSGDSPESIDGDLDDFCVWRIPPSAETIARLAHSPVSASRTLAPFVSLAAESGRLFFSLLESFFRVVDRLNPRQRDPVFHPELPVLSLRMSAADSRHFIRSHEESLLSGYRTERATDLRRIAVSYEGRTEECRIGLADTYSRERLTKRPSYLVSAPSGFLSSGSGVACLWAPEEWSNVHPDAPSLFPENGVVPIRLFIDQTFVGVYFLESFDRNGSAWKSYGFRNPVKTATMHFDAPFGAVCGGEADGALARAVLSGDVHFPWSRSEMRYWEGVHQQEWEANRFAPSAVNEFDFLGTNPAPFFVVGDLDLSKVRDCLGADVRLESSAPAFLSADGKLLQRPETEPMVVTLSAYRKEAAEPLVFRFRIMPEKRALPTFFVYGAEPLSKMRRTDFTCLYWPADAEQGEWRLGLAGLGNGGIKTRGNTSYVRGLKRSMSLEFEQPHGIIGNPGLEHLNFYNGYADSTRLRNALSFHLFQASNETGSRPYHHAPSIFWAEVFYNGSYHGICEFGDRIDEKLVLSADLALRVNRPSQLFYEDNPRVLSQRFPDPEKIDTFPWFREQVKFVREASEKEFREHAPERFELESLADFLLCLMITQNMDGRVTNIAVCRAKETGRLFFVPWDYDKTFFLGETFRVLNNSLTHRLVKESPEFRQILHDRWTLLRKSAFDAERLEEWIDEQAALLAPYRLTDLDYAVVFPDSPRDIPQEIELLKKSLRFNLFKVGEWVESLQPQKSELEKEESPAESAPIE